MSEAIPVAVIGAPAPYREAVLRALDSDRFTTQVPDDELEWLAEPQIRAALVMIQGREGWALIERSVRSPDTIVVALTPDLSVGQFARALGMGCDAVVQADTSAEIIASVLDAAVIGEVLLPVEAARRLAKALHSEDPTPLQLSSDDVHVLRELSSGVTVVKLAEQIAWSERTLRRRLHNVYLKLGVENRAQAIAKASQLGFLD